MNRAVIRPLTDRETALLSECEETIAAGIMTFAEVGEALLTVRDEKLFRRDFATFEDYCVARWQISRQRAYQLMDAAALVSTIVDKGLPAPTNEAQARALAAVPEDALGKVWTTVHDRTDGKPTAAAIRAAAEEAADVAASAPDEGEEQAPDSGTAAAGGLGGAPAAAPQDQPAASSLGLAEADGVGAPDAGAVSTAAPEEPPAGPVGGSSHDNLVASPVGPMTPEFAAALDELVPDQDPHREWRKRFFDAIVASRKLMRFAVEDVAKQADAESVTELHRVARDLATYSDRVGHAIAARWDAEHPNVTQLRRAK